MIQTLTELMDLNKASLTVPHVSTRGRSGALNPDRRNSLERSDFYRRLKSGFILSGVCVKPWTQERQEL